jgi:hypothetical protein
MSMDHLRQVIGYTGCVTSLDRGTPKRLAGTSYVGDSPGGTVRLWLGRREPSND